MSANQQSSSPSRIRQFYSRRFRWARHGAGGTWGWVSLALGTAVAVVVWFCPNWSKQYISERMNAFVTGLIPLVAGASVFICRWLFSPYFVYKNTLIEHEQIISGLRSQIADSGKLLDQRQHHQEIRNHLSRFLKVAIKLNNQLNNTDIEPITEAVEKWIIDVCIFLRENLGEAEENRFESNTNIPPAPECRFEPIRAGLLETVHKRSYQLNKILDELSQK
jgi:hypothetical protein